MTKKIKRRGAVLSTFRETAPVETTAGSDDRTAGLKAPPGPRVSLPLPHNVSSVINETRIENHCPSCQSTEISVHYRLTDYAIAICGQCASQLQPDFQGGGAHGHLFRADYFLARQSAASPIFACRQSPFRCRHSRTEWSPDGKKIAFHRVGTAGNHSPSEGIYLVNPNGSGAQQINQAPQENFVSYSMHPTW